MHMETSEPDSTLTRKKGRIRACIAFAVGAIGCSFYYWGTMFESAAPNPATGQIYRLLVVQRHSHHLFYFVNRFDQIALISSAIVGLSGLIAGCVILYYADPNQFYRGVLKNGIKEPTMTGKWDS